jgi:hypothetical protein
MLSNGDETFLATRARLLSAWRYVGVGILVGYLAAVTWLVLRSPLLFNPWAVLSRLQAGTYPPSLYKLVAAFLPVMALLCLLLVLCILLFLFSTMQHEKRYQAIITALRTPPVDSDVDGTPAG